VAKVQVVEMTPTDLGEVLDMEEEQHFHFLMVAEH
jgi:hypothetical protein